MKHLAVVFSLAILVGCVGLRPMGDTGAGDQKEILIKSIPSSPPAWIHKIPKEDKTNYYFVGISGKHQLERDARADAFEDAVKSVAKFIGVDVSNVLQMLDASYGLSSQVADPTVAGKTRIDQTSEAYFHKLKANDWCIQKYEIQTPDKRVVGTYQMAYVLVAIPRKDIDNAIQLRDEINKEKKTEEINKEQQRHCQAETLIVRAKEAIQQAEMDEALTLLTQSLSVLEGLNSPLTSEAKSLIEKIKGMDPLRMKARNMVLSLTNSLVLRATELPRVTVSNLTLEDSKMGSQFGRYFQEMLSVELSSVKNVLCVKESTPDSLMLSGSYWIVNGDVEVRASLTNSKGEAISQGLFKISKGLIPENLSLLPENYTKAKEEVTAFTEKLIAEEKKDFGISLWTDKGRDGVYQEGELMQINFKTSKDAYLYLFYRTNEGKILQIFPNLYGQDNFIKADTVYTIPDKNNNFEFKISPPFGIEAIKAVASLTPMPELGASIKKNVFEETDSSAGNFRTRAVTVIPKKGTAEASCVITTMAKETPVQPAEAGFITRGMTTLDLAQMREKIIAYNKQYGTPYDRVLEEFDKITRQTQEPEEVLAELGEKGYGDLDGLIIPRSRSIDGPKIVLFNPPNNSVLNKPFEIKMAFDTLPGQAIDWNSFMVYYLKMARFNITEYLVPYLNKTAKSLMVPQDIVVKNFQKGSHQILVRIKDTSGHESELKMNLRVE